MLTAIVAVAIWAAPLPSNALTIRSADGQVRSLSSYGFAMGNQTFNVSAPAWQADVERPTGIDQGAHQRVVFVEMATVTVNVAEWADACARNGCAGLVLYVAPGSLLRTIVEMLAWSYWVPRPGAFATLPIVVAVDTVGAIGTSDIVVMASDRDTVEQNPAGIALRRAPVVILFSCIAAALVLLSLADIVRVLQFSVDDSWRVRAPPWPTTVNICFLVLSQVVRTIRAINIAWCREQGLPYAALVFVNHIDMPLSATARIALNVTVSRLMTAELSARPVLTAYYAVTAAGVLLTAAMYVVVDVASGTQVLPMGVIATHLFLLSTSILYTVTNAYPCWAVLPHICKSKRQGRLTPDASSTRRPIYIRLCSSWVMATLVLLSQLAVLAVQNTSPFHFLVAYGVSQVMAIVWAIPMLVAYRPKSSAIDRCLMAACTRWCRRGRGRCAPTAGAPIVVAMSPMRNITENASTEIH